VKDRAAARNVAGQSQGPARCTEGPRALSQQREGACPCNPEREERSCQHLQRANALLETGCQQPPSLGCDLAEVTVGRGGLQTTGEVSPPRLPMLLLCLCQPLLLAPHLAGTWLSHPFPSPPVSLHQLRSVPAAPRAAADWDGRHSHNAAKKQLGSPLTTVQWGKSIFIHFQSYLSEK